MTRRKRPAARGRAAGLDLSVAHCPSPPGPRVGEPYPCPGCGSAAWVADYFESVHQDVRLVVSGDGSPAIEEWLGATETYDDGATDDEGYRCTVCNHFLAATAHSSSNPVVLLNAVHDELRGQEWSPDTLDRIAEILRSGGYVIEEPAGDRKEG